jgi:thiamine-phosphate pyrophosphorylase
VRERLDSGILLGVSVRTVDEALAAERAGADYLGVGAVFPTATKADAENIPLSALTEICASSLIPVVAIGGINEKNIHLLSGTGIAGVALVSALFAHPERVRDSTRRMVELAKAVCRP